MKTTLEEGLGRELNAKEIWNTLCAELSCSPKWKGKMKIDNNLGYKMRRMIQFFLDLVFFRAM